MTDEPEFVGDVMREFDDLIDGAARDSVEEEELRRLPRILRYAVMAVDRAVGTRRRLAAEIVEAVPELRRQVQAWVATPSLDATVELAADLDRLSVKADTITHRSLADAVRMVALPLPAAGRAGSRDYARVASTLVKARVELPDGLSGKLYASVDVAVLGWLSAPFAVDGFDKARLEPAILAGGRLARMLITSSIDAAVDAAVGKSRALPSGSLPTAQRDEDDEEAWDAAAPCPPGYTIVCRREIVGPVTARNNEVLRGHEDVLNRPVPLVPCPDLTQVRATLVREFPYAVEAIDFILASLVGRPFVRLAPVLLVGGPGCGKTRFARRLAELLKVGLWRVDGGQPDGSAFAGTDRRWQTAAPCTPFLAISRYKQANPMVAIDELDKAATRTDYGRLWDTLLPFLEIESAQAYPDQGLTANVDVSAVSYVATANSIASLPGPLLDRFRVVRFPEARRQDLDALLTTIVEDLFRERGVDPRFHVPFTAAERGLILSQWGGGSLRRLRRMTEVLLRAGERSAVVH